MTKQQAAEYRSEAAGNGGAVDLKSCPSYPPKCKCGACTICGFKKHMAIHGPSYGQPPGSRPYGHEYSPPRQP